MKKIILLVCLISGASSFAKELAKVNLAILRDNFITHGKTCVINDTDTNIVYEDERTYIEMDIVEIAPEYIMLRCLVSTAAPDSNGMLVVRGMPRLMIPINNGLGMASLNCDGKDEHFMLIASICLI
ncbi:MAG: hypothetical protein AMXMBFR12_02900 [Candidatus Babeliales bacterium]